MTSPDGPDGPDVVAEVGFDVRAGEILGLVGESGSGKTTVALALLGYARRGVSITSGSVRVDGVDLLKLRSKELRGLRGSTVAYVPQDPAAALNPAWRIGRQLREILTVHPSATTKGQSQIRKVLEDVALPTTDAFLRRYPHQLSGGQQQRVAIAMAFACSPSLIVFDEPTTGLDVTTQRHVLSAVRSLCAEYGVAAVYVSHDLAVVSEVASKVAVLYAGRVIEIGTTSAVLGSPIHPYSRGLLAAVPVPDRTEVLRGIEGRSPRPGHRPPGCAFAPRCGSALASCSEPGQPPVLQVNGSLVRCLRADETVLRETRAIFQTPVPAEQLESPILEIIGLNASYKNVTILQDANLSVPAETCVAIVGESGSGKTTLARCIAGIHKEFSGTLRLEGEALQPSYRSRSTSDLRRVQYVFQNPYTSLNPRKTIAEILEKPLIELLKLPRAERYPRVSAALEEMSLPEELLSRYPDQLSGGERQRVAIARALIVEPDVVICDEVTSALDVSVQAVIVELLRKLQRERHLSMIFITHNLALVRSIAQTVAVLDRGRIVEFGDVTDILDHPADPYTSRLMADVPRLAT